MPTTLPDVPVSNSEWVSLNAASQIAVGERFWIQVKTRYGIRIIEDNVKPELDDERGHLIEGYGTGNNEGTFDTGALEIWALAKVDSLIVCQRY